MSKKRGPLIVEGIVVLFNVQKIDLDALKFDITNFSI